MSFLKELFVHRNARYKIVSFTNVLLKHVNTHQIEIKQTYIDPSKFKKTYQKSDLEKSNLAVIYFKNFTR